MQSSKRTHRAERIVRAGSVRAGGHVANFRPDVVALVCAAITHEAHHRGQICHWARQLGAPITPEQQLKLWEWDKRWKEVAGG
jgi:DinB family protein